ncbi:transaldolase 1 [Dactylonectria estremocensis]|uniref:Transaldolase n=1 Tax=Dactylonectria estremocensis TaxID=1079267 RepID=A0A9P9ELV2_9HYPO|nr:transaldolase 1 [Dactylonectria estremocensis]
MAFGPLQQLQDAGTVLIADTADFEKIARFQASEGTTNPSLLYAAAQSSSYAALISKTISYAKALPSSVSDLERLSTAVDFLAVQFGTQIYKLTGKVSTEVDVTLSFDTTATVAAALRIIDLYKQEGVAKEQVRIKISATWEGIQAARILQSEYGISCLVTVVFSLVQAIAAAEAGVDAIAPYVGRIADWGKLHGAEGDLGVETVSEIQNYLRKYGSKTKVMAASFRNVNQVRDLAGIDLLTAAPVILEAVEKETEPIVAKLTAQSAHDSDLAEVSYINDESAFRWAFNADACAVEKSADAMKRFGDDTDKLKVLLAGFLA